MGTSLQSWTVNPSWNRGLTVAVEGAPQSLFSAHRGGSEFRAAGGVAELFTGTRSPRMQPPPTPPPIPWTVCTPWAMSSSHLLPGPIWLSWFSAGQPWCLLLDCSGHQAGLLSGQLSRLIFPLLLAASPPHLSPCHDRKLVGQPAKNLLSSEPGKK